MPVSAIVLTLDTTECPELLSSLGQDPRVLLGQSNGLHVPLVLDTETIAESEAVVDWLNDQSGVVAAELVAVDFSADDEEQAL